MNQILSFKSTENGRKILMKNTKNLCIFLIIFAMILLVEGAWRLYTNLNKEVNVSEPEIIGYGNSDKTIFNVKSDVGIKKIVYAWNGAEENTIEKNGEKEFSFEIENRIGVNDLILKTVDVEDATVTYENIKIVYDQNNITPPQVQNGEEDDDGLGELEEDDNPTPNDIDWEQAVANDKTKPTVTLTSGQGKVVITASDDVKMSYVTYSWNEGEETTITGLSEDEKTLSAEIDAIRGDNKLKIKAYDKAGNSKEIEKSVHGTDGPQITVKKDEGKLNISVTDEFGITKIEYNFNNEEKTFENIEGTNYEFSVDLVDGENFIIINAYEGNVKSEYKGKTTK